MKKKKMRMMMKEEEKVTFPVFSVKEESEVCGLIQEMGNEEAWEMGSEKSRRELS